MTDIQKEPQYSTTGHKRKVLLEIFTKLKKASLGCGEIDLPLFGEILLMKYEEMASEFEPNNPALKDLKERIKKIKNCEPNPDYNIEVAGFICENINRRT